ncbi:MAG: porin [Aquificaceae bacterium]
MKNKKVIGVFMIAAALFTPEFSHAIRLSGASEDQYLDINFLMQIWFRQQDISSQNRPNFINASSRSDIFFRRVRLRFGGSVNPWFKFNFVLRDNDFGRDPYDAPFGGQPTHTKRQSNRNTGTIHELDAILVPSVMADMKDITLDLHLGYPRVPLGREQFQRAYDNLDLDRTNATLRWTHLTVGDVTGRAFGGYVHIRGSSKGQGYSKITVDGFLGLFGGFKNVRNPWDETILSSPTCGSLSAAECISRARGNSSNSPLVTLRGVVSFGDPEGRPAVYSWLYRDTYLAKRRGVTIGVSYAFQNNIDQHIITDTQGLSPGVPNNGAGTVHVRIPYLLLPNPLTPLANILLDNKVNMKSYGVDFAWHHGPVSFVSELGQVKFDKLVLVDGSNPYYNQSIKNEFWLVKGGYMVNPQSKHKFEPYISYSEYKPQIVRVGSSFYGDATNFIAPNTGPTGPKSYLGKIKQLGVGINYYYINENFRWTLEYTKLDE